MKKARQFFSLMITLLMIMMAGDVHAQGRGHHKVKERDSEEHLQRRDHRSDHYRHNGRVYHYKHEKHDKHQHDRGKVRHVVHHHDRYCNHAPVVVHHRPGPRYIFYRDYDVYYDLHRRVYITYSGRNWAVSTTLPVVLHRVDARRVVRMEVDYDQDDFPQYLQTRRPSYRKVYTEF